MSEVVFGKTGESIAAPGDSSSVLPLDIQGENPNAHITPIKLDAM